MRFYAIVFIATAVAALFSCQPSEKTESDRYLNKFSDELNLQRLEDGVDSFELRFNTEISVLKCGFGQLLVIKKIENEWTCLEYHYIVNDIPFGTRDYVKDFSIDTVSIYKRHPKSGWTKLFEELEKQHIYDLPSQYDIPSWDSLGVTIADGKGYSVEFADNQRHRYYSYNTPQDFATQLKECRNMSNIIE